MNSDRFNQIIENRAQQRVKERVAKFEKAIGTAFRELHNEVAPNYYDRWSGGDRGKRVAAIMRHLTGAQGSPEKPSGYPQMLWDEERAAVEKELLATMDEMAKALAAPAPANIPPSAETVPVNT